MAQFSLYVHKGGLKPDSFHFLLELRNIYYFTHFLFKNMLVEMSEQCYKILFSNSAHLRDFINILNETNCFKMLLVYLSFLIMFHHFNIPKAFYVKLCDLTKP